MQGNKESFLQKLKRPPHDTEFLGTIHQNEWGRAEQNRRFDRDVGSFLTGNLRTGMTDEVAGDCKLQQTVRPKREQTIINLLPKNGQQKHHSCHGATDSSQLSNCRTGLAAVAVLQKYLAATNSPLGSTLLHVSHQNGRCRHAKYLPASTLLPCCDLKVSME